MSIMSKTKHTGEKLPKPNNVKKKNWGGIRQENEDIKRLHEEWARENGYRNNDLLHATNTERIIKDAKE